MNNLRTFNHLYPQEKVWLHCDNTAYFQGDTIWFAAYVTSAETLKPNNNLSKTLYVELLNEEGEVVSTQRLQIVDGHCHGQIPLNTEMEKRFVTETEREKSFYPVNPYTENYYMPLPSGFYEVRAYTRGMLNWGTNVCFSRVFPVFDIPEREGDYSLLSMENREKKQRGLMVNPIRSKTAKENSLNVDFYPEGGKIIYGLPCRVAYKVTDKDGRNSTAQCKLLADGQVLVQTMTIHDGMGKFSFVPQKGVKYKLQVETDERELFFELPHPSSQGIMLTVDATGTDSVRMAIAATDSLLHKTFGMSITCRGKLLRFNVYDGIAKHPTRIPSIAKSRLLPGVNQVTLFDADGQVYAERLFFVHDTAIVGKDPIECLLDKADYKPFEKINLSIASHKGKGRGTLSLSVRDSGTEIGTTYADNLQTYLLLTSDLKGYIHRPDYYFEMDDSVHRTALDLLMMTQGWRRYEWKQLAGVEEFKKTHFIEDGLTLHGQVKHPKYRNTYLPNIRVAAIVSKEKEPIQKGSMLTDREGCFTFVMMPFTGRYNLNLNLTDTENKLTDGRILLHRHFSPKPREYNSMEKDILSIPQPPQMLKGALSLTGDNLLEDIQVERNRRQFEPFTLHNIKEEREKALDIDDRIFPQISIEGYIEDKYTFFEGEEILWSFEVGGYKGKNQEFVSYRDFKGRRIQDFELEYVDYIRVYHNQTSHRKVKWASPISTQTLNKEWTFINCWIYRKPKDIKGLRTTHIDGYSEVIDYYHPQYNREIIPGEVDYRRTLYWNPCVELNEQGKVDIMFYNNGTCKRPTISIETLNK
ncbi:MAG: hypothetical protein IJX44_08115 [Bacteroidaceae bacterium]|nr:hypothetical protein [Bacteroidaceae bacterium]